MSGPPQLREVVTPEGVPLHLTVARLGDRLGAALLDVTLLSALSLPLLLLVLPFGGEGAGQLAAAVLTVANFLLRAFYFPFFELRWHGQTPGKRALRIRVVDRGGGPLTARSLIARNLLREVELFQPLAVLVAPQATFGAFPGWVGVCAACWTLACASLPFLSRDRLRGGDLIGGTLVVRAPPLLLLDDLSERVAAGERFTFTAAQLEFYGAYELQTLESLLRLGDSGRNQAALEAVAEKIQRKIGWATGGAPVPAYPFLRDFYAAQRARLEHRLLFGERRQRKRPG
jgi:uncharacterized RDD family membrane protein YckC